MKFLDLLESTIKKVVFYVDKGAPEVFYAQYINQIGVTEFSRIDSFAFRRYLTLESARVTQNVQIIDVERSIKYLQYELSAYGECEEITSFVRIAGNLDSTIEYDLQNSSGESVIVSRSGWKIDNKNSFVAKFVSTLKRFCNKEYGCNVWQNGYYDHVVRNFQDYIETFEYIENNPMKWFVKNHPQKSL